MYKDSKYTEVFESLKANSCKFNATSDDYFLQSLAFDMYDGWTQLTSDTQLECMDIDERIGMTSVYNTGYIYYEDSDCYYTINIHYADNTLDMYEVTVSYRSMLFTENDNGEISKTIV